MIVLGLDISMTATGWAIANVSGQKPSLLRCGVIETKKSKDKGSGTLDSIRRARHIYVELGKVLSSELGLKIELNGLQPMLWHPQNLPL